MKFGFLIDATKIECDEFVISAAPNHDDIIDEFYRSASVSNGWIYEGTTLPHTDEESIKFITRNRASISLSISPPLTHEISSKRDDNFKRFMILGYSFLQGIYLVAEDTVAINRAPYRQGILTGILPTQSDCVNGMRQIAHYYNCANQSSREQAFACLSWFLIGQSHLFEWERFDSQYKVLDAMYKLTAPEQCSHSKRPKILANHYKISIPEWAQIDDAGSCELSRIRNEFVHEAKYAGHPIGYNLTSVNFDLELVAFNVKLIASMLGINTPYLKVDPKDRNHHTWNISTIST